MATKLYIGNLSYETTDQDLQTLFAESGNVTSAQVVTDRYSGQSRGFGFVEMGTQDEAHKAIAALNGHTLAGRALVVNESRPQAPRSNSGGYGGGNRSGGNRSGGSGRW